MNSGRLLFFIADRNKEHNIRSFFRFTNGFCFSPLKNLHFYCGNSINISSLSVFSIIFYIKKRKNMKKINVLIEKVNAHPEKEVERLVLQKRG